MIAPRFLVALSLLLTACGGAGREVPRADTLVRLADSDARGLDSQKVADLASLRVAGDQFEGLMRHGADGAPMMGLAEERRCTPDALICRYRLRSGLRFSDGTPIEAAHFVRALARLRDPATAAPTAGLFDAIARIRATDPRTVEVRLHRPAHLDDLLAHPALAALPFHRIAVAGDRWTSDRPLVTSGAYRLREWRLGDRLVLERNPRWIHGAAPFARLEWRPAEDMLAMLRRFRGGLADTTSEIPPTRLAWARRNLPGAVHVAPYAGTYYFAFNTRRPPFDDVRVRRALSLAVNRDWIAHRLLGTGEAPATGLIPPALGGRNPDPLGQGDRLRIRRLLAAAGYGPDRPLRFTIRINSGGDHRRVAVALAAMWKPYGVEAAILNSEAQLHFAALRNGDFDLARSGWIADVPDPGAFLSVHSTASPGGNYSGYADSVYDRLVARARAGDAAALAQAERRIAQDVPVLPLYFYVSRSLVAPDLAGWQDNPMNLHPSSLLERKVPRNR